MASKKGKAHPLGINMKPSRTELGKFIRSRRLELNLRQVLLADRAGLARNVVSMFEIGTREYLKDHQLVSLAEGLQCDPNELRKLMPTKAQPTTELGKLIRYRREELNLSLPVFAGKLGVTLQQAKNLEARKSPTIHYGLIKPLADVLNLDLSTLARFAGTTFKQSKSEFGQIIRTHRKELGMSIRTLAKELGVSFQFVNQIELGQCPLSESDERIVQLANILGLDVEELLAVRSSRMSRRGDKKRKGYYKHRETALGDFMTRRRLELNLNQTQVADKASVHRDVIGRIERGSCRPDDLMLGKISQALGCEIPEGILESMV